MNIIDLEDKDLCKLIDNRWKSSDSVWEIVKKSMESNSKHYDSYVTGELAPDYIRRTPVKRNKVRSNRIFTNVEAVINTLISNLPKLNLIPTRETPEAKELAIKQEGYFNKKYDDRNFKEIMRKGLRNLYLSRLIVLKPFWNAKINDFDAISVDPRKVRFAKNSTKEVESEFAIEEIEDSIANVIKKFPKKEKAILAKAGITEDNKSELLISNPKIKYKEAWVKDSLIVKYDEIIMSKGKNPYWDWDGVQITEDQGQELRSDDGDQKKILDQATPTPTEEKLPLREGAEEQQTKEAYFYNHFDEVRKPYIFATVLNNENTPVGRTDFISQAAPLQESLDRRKRQIDDNAQMVNGITKVNSETMDKADAQKLRYETEGIIWGKGVVTGVQRETGNALPNFVFEDMQDSRNEIDTIMAATSAFKGEREGQETKAGRLALVSQSFLRLNELVQVTDYINYELLNWMYHLAKLRYTETHYAKTMGSDNAVNIIEITRNDLQDGTELKVIAGKTLPEDNQFKYQQAQEDIAKGIISPVDYFTITKHDNPQEIAKNAELYKINPVKASGVSDEELQEILPPQQKEEEKPPSISISYSELTPDLKAQAATKAGLEPSEEILFAEELQNKRNEEIDRVAKNKPKEAKETKQPKV